MTWPVATADLVHPVNEADRFAAGTGDHVAVDQRVVSGGVLAVELCQQLTLKATHAGLMHSAGVVRHQPGNTVIHANRPKKSGPVKRVKAGLSQRRPVANVVQPYRRHEHSIHQAKLPGYPFGLGGCRLNMAPATRQRRSQIPLSEQPSLRDLRHGPRAYVVLWQVDGGTGSEERGEGGRPYPGTKC